MIPLPQGGWVGRPAASDPGGRSPAALAFRPPKHTPDTQPRCPEAAPQKTPSTTMQRYITMCPSIHPCVHPSIHPSCHPSIHTFVQSFVWSYVHCFAGEGFLGAYFRPGPLGVLLWVAGPSWEDLGLWRWFLGPSGAPGSRKCFFLYA